MKNPPKKYRLTEDDIAYLRDHFHNTPDEELAETLGVTVFCIKSRRTKMGLKKDKDYLRELNRQRAVKHHNGARINTPEAKAKRIATQKRKYAEDRIRIKWGMRQKTKYHLRLEPVSKQRQRNRLKANGYIIDETNLIAYYTPRTHRATRLEAIPRGVKKGSIKPYYDFRPYAEREQRLDK